MKTLSKVAVVSLILLASSAAPGKDGVVIECPKSVFFKPAAPAGWTVGFSTEQPFMTALILDGAVHCAYAYANSSGHPVGDIFQAIPKGMNCKVNPSSARQYDCLPGKDAGGGVTGGGIRTK